MNRDTEAKTPRPSWHAGIESFRVLAAFAIILIHAKYFVNQPPFTYHSYAYLFMDCFNRFSVPFYFLTAGYFFYGSCEKGNSPGRVFRRTAGKLLLLYAAWTVIYAAVPRDIVGGIQQQGIVQGLLSGGSDQIHRSWWRFRSHPLYYLFESTSIHLWFLPALLCGLGLLTLFVKARAERYLLPAAILLYLFGMAASSYKSTALGIHLPFLFDGKDGPFTSTLHVAVGWMFAKHNVRVSLNKALLLVLAGYGLCLMENLAVRPFLSEPLPLNVAASHVLLGAAMFLTALALPEAGKAHAARLGPYTLGIYLAQFLAGNLIWRLYVYFPPAAWEIFFPVLIFCVSAAAVMALSKTRAAWLVSRVRKNA
ncbi:MAG TPA: acyltransferase [Verrucomicrobiae bacterium]|nr:acyltransferase [Verrucomicrobiae bacterium]